MSADGPCGYRCVVNARAGGVDGDVLSAVTGPLEGTGAPTDAVATSGPGEVRRVVEELPEGWALVVCGGDGSLHVALQALWDTGRRSVPVGVVPLGTGNDLARGVDLPLDDPAAAQRIARGRPRALDLLVDDDGRVCSNAAHTGVGAEAAARAADLKELLAEVAYPVAALLTGLDASGTPATVEVDDAVVSTDEALMVAVCNAPRLGGGTRLAPDAGPGDALLDVVVVAATGPLARASLALDLQRGEHLGRDDVRCHRGRTVSVGMPGARHDVDGEVTEPGATSRRWRVEPAAWYLVA